MPTHLLVAIGLGLIDKLALLFKRARDAAKGVDNLNRRVHVLELNIDYSQAAAVSVEALLREIGCLPFDLHPSCCQH